MAKRNYNLHLKGYVGSYDFDADYVDYVLAKNADKEVHVLIDSLGGSLATALSIVAAFRNHGNVHVHYVGMNASAATIASLGAASVSIDASAMYLVHKCSMEFFQWASANSDKLQSIIDEAEQMKSDLEKMDANVAKMYAAKCKRKPEDLLALMKKGGWLTASEAQEWGFVDEVTDYEDDAAPVMTDLVAADMSAAGIPVPSSLASQDASQTLLTRFIESLTKLFKNNKPMKPENQAPETTQQEPAATPATPPATPAEDVVKAKDEEIASLKAEIERLKKAPGDVTTHVVDEHRTDGEPVNEVEDFVNTFNRAKELYNMVNPKP